VIAKTIGEPPSDFSARQMLQYDSPGEQANLAIEMDSRRTAEWIGDSDPDCLKLQKSNGAEASQEDDEARHLAHRRRGRRQMTYSIEWSTSWKFGRV